MTILETLEDNNIEKVKSFIKKYDDTKNEFEISFFQNSPLLTLSRFNNLISVLDNVTKKNDVKYGMKKTIDLDIIFSLKDDTNNFTNYRITISSLEKINEYMEMLHDRKNHLVFSILLKFIIENKNNKYLKIIKKVKDVENYILLEDFYMKFKLDEELTLSKEEFTKLSDIKKNYSENINNITYRYKTRTSYYLLKNKNVFQIDLTNVKQAYSINDIDKAINRSEIEMECLIIDKKTALEDIFSVSEFIIKIIQQTNNIISVSNSNNIVNIYKDLMGIKINIIKLLGRQGVSVESSHVIDTLPNRYTVTDKADGERNILIVIKGKCYLISNNLIVKDIGISINEKFNNSILDGEYIFISKYNKYLYMVFECLVISNNDCRNEENFMRRIALSDELIENINKSDFKYTKMENIDINNINKILKYHSDKMIEFYDDILEYLKKSKSNTLIRRKYFINCNGVYDNEIFTYSNMMWTLFEKNSNLKCPYFIDGLVYQPSNQKYENPGKLSDLKWKPPHHNSIDFYIEFEKDVNTGKILTVYDNSLYDKTLENDENFENVINKTYQICNLYVNNTKNNIDSYVLFDKDTKYSQCYIAIDETNNIRSEDGKIINDKTVVEFYYNLEYDEPLNWRWKPRNTRYDKTENVQKYKKGYGNSYYTSIKIWNTIQNPVKITDFLDFSDISKYDYYIKKFREKISNAVIKQSKDEYYQIAGDKNKSFGDFQNWVKSQIMYTYINKYYNNIQYTVIDFGSGQGGDLQKFYYITPHLYVGIDPVRNEIYKISPPGAIARLNSMKKKYPNFPPTFFVVSSATSLLNLEDQEKSVGRMNDDEKKTFNKFFSVQNPTVFDRANSSFSLHYYLQDEESWMNFCSNLNTHLREGAYFTFETFNGDKIRALLKDKDIHQFTYDENGETKIIAEIIKKYNEDNTSPYGNTISVYMDWISQKGVYLDEFIVDPKFIIKSLKDNCNMELIEMDNFENMYENYEPYLKNIHLNDITDPFKNKHFSEGTYKFYSDSPKNKPYKDYSFLSCYYVFKKKEINLEEIKKKYYNRVNKVLSDKSKK